MYRIGSACYEIDDRLVLHKAAKSKYDKTATRKSKSGKDMVFNDQTKRWVLADKQSGDSSKAKSKPKGEDVGGLPVISDKPAKAKAKPKAEPKPKATKSKAKKPAPSEPSPWDSDETDPGPPPKTTLKPKSEKKSPLLLAPGKDEPAKAVKAEVVDEGGSGSAIASTATKPAIAMQGYIKDATAAAGRLGKATRGMLQTSVDSAAAVTSSIKTAKSQVTSALSEVADETKKSVEAHFGVATEAVDEIKAAVTASHGRIQDSLSDVNESLTKAATLAGEAVQLLKDGVTAKGSSGKRESSFTKAKKKMKEVQQMVLDLDQKGRAAFQESVAAVADLGSATGKARQKAESSAAQAIANTSGVGIQSGKAVKAAVDSVSTAMNGAVAKIHEAAKAVGQESADLYHSVRSVGLQAEAVVQGFARQGAQLNVLPESKPMKKAAIAPGRVYLRPKSR
jgi:hypothetical protein